MPIQALLIQALLIRALLIPALLILALPGRELPTLAPRPPKPRRISHGALRAKGWREYTASA